MRYLGYGGGMIYLRVERVEGWGGDNVEDPHVQ